MKNTTETSKTISSMAKESMNGRINGLMLASGKMDKCMDKEFLNGLRNCLWIMKRKPNQN